MMNRKRVAVSALLGLVLAGLAGTSMAVPVAQRELDWVLKRTPDAKNGARLYETCAACHGRAGEGVSDGSVPAIGGQHFIVIAKQLVDFRAGVRADPRMKHFSDTRHLAISQDVADVAAYVSALPVSPPRAEAARKGTARGEILYTRNCARCHGESGEGREDELAPRLASQHYEYLLQQLENVGIGARPPMVEAHQKPLAGLSKDDVAAIAASLAATP